MLCIWPTLFLLIQNAVNLFHFSCLLAFLWFLFLKFRYIFIQLVFIDDLNLGLAACLNERIGLVAEDERRIVVESVRNIISGGWEESAFHAVVDRVLALLVMDRGTVIRERWPCILCFSQCLFLLEVAILHVSNMVKSRLTYPDILFKLIIEVLKMVINWWLILNGWYLWVIRVNALMNLIVWNFSILILILASIGLQGGSFDQVDLFFVLSEKWANIIVLIITDSSHIKLFIITNHFDVWSIRRSLIRSIRVNIRWLCLCRLIFLILLFALVLKQILKTLFNFIVTTWAGFRFFLTHFSRADFFLLGLGIVDFALDGASS